MRKPPHILLVALLASSCKGVNAIFQSPSGANHHDVFGATYIGDILEHLINGKKTFNTVLEYGSSGGYIVNGLVASEKYGIEHNPLGRRISQTRNPRVKVYEDIAHLNKSMRTDVIFTASALEHVTCPVCELQELRKFLAPYGALIVGVRNDGLDPLQTFHNREADAHHHIYTWNPLLLSNMVKLAGFEPCGAIAEYNAWWKIDLDLYHKNRFQYCRKGIRLGRKQHKENLWAIAVRPEDKLICQNYTRKLEELQDCRYLDKKHSEHPPRFRNSPPLIPP